jgi:hypothetical protein
MHHRSLKSGWITVLVVAGLATMSLAQDGMTSAKNDRSGRGAFGFMSVLERKVGLTPEQKDAVKGLLAEQRQKSQALRDETDSKIRAMLNAEQQKKFDEVLAQQKTRRTQTRTSAS